MKCENCGESNAEYVCSECGAYWCESCAEDRDGACCVQTIVPLKRRTRK